MTAIGAGNLNKSGGAKRTGNIVTRRSSADYLGSALYDTVLDSDRRRAGHPKGGSQSPERKGGYPDPRVCRHTRRIGRLAVAPDLLPSAVESVPVVLRDPSVGDAKTHALRRAVSGSHTRFAVVVSAGAESAARSVDIITGRAIGRELRLAPVVFVGRAAVVFAGIRIVAGVPGVHPAFTHPGRRALRIAGTRQAVVVSTIANVLRGKLQNSRVPTQHGFNGRHRLDGPPTDVTGGASGGGHVEVDLHDISDVKRLTTGFSKFQGHATVSRSTNTDATLALVNPGAEVVIVTGRAVAHRNEAALTGAQNTEPRVALRCFGHAVLRPPGTRQPGARSGNRAKAVGLISADLPVVVAAHTDIATRVVFRAEVAVVTWVVVG